MKDIMVDIETLATTPNAVILTIGAIKFSRNGPLLPLDKLDTFYERIDIKSCQKHGLVIDDDTLKWWNTQDCAFETLHNPDRIKLKKALKKFTEWIDKCEIIWAKSPDFDCVILKNAFTVCGLQTPWKFWNTRCCRTVMDIATVKDSDITRNNNAHHALYDCYHQISLVKKALDKLC